MDKIEQLSPYGCTFGPIWHVRKFVFKCGGNICGSSNFFLRERDRHDSNTHVKQVSSGNYRKMKAFVKAFAILREPENILSAYDVDIIYSSCLILYFIHQLICIINNDYLILRREF